MRFGAEIAYMPLRIRCLRDDFHAFLVHFSALFVCDLCAISTLPNLFFVFFAGDGLCI